MKFYMIYSNQYGVGTKPIGIASLAAMLKKAGHQFRLFDCTQFSVMTSTEFSDSNTTGEKNLMWMTITNKERMPQREQVTYSQLINKVIADIDSYKPDMIGLSVLSDDYPLGLRIMDKAKKTFSKIPTVCGGVHATCDPLGVMSEKCFDMVCVGEGEYVILDLAKRVEEKRDFFKIKNLWVRRKDGSIERNLVRPYEQNLDMFPFPDWSIYTEASWYKPYKGYVYKYGDFEMSRGCPYKCSYCVNVQMHWIYKSTGGNYHREKSIKRVVDEIKSAREKYGVEFLKFWDETFLLMSKKRLEEFVDTYSSQIGLPYVTETTAQSITPFTAQMLKKSNCKSISVGLETGSPDLRNGILHKPTDNEVYLKAFKLLEENGIQKVSFNMLGLPTEKEEDIFKTIAMNKLCKTEVQSIGNFYPYKGTPIRKMLIEKGLLNEAQEKEILKSYDFTTLTTNDKSVIRFSDMDNDVVNKLINLFAVYVTWPVILWPLIDLIKNEEENDEFTKLLWDKIRTITYFEKFREWPEGRIFTMDTKEQDYDSNLNHKEANKFVKLLIGIWGENFKEKIKEKLSLIKNGKLKPEFAVPENEEELKSFLGVQKTTIEERREIRQKLRLIAEKDSLMYRSA